VQNNQFREWAMSDIQSSFSVVDNGHIQITLDDPTFVRAETVLVNRQSLEVHALLQQKLHLLGALPSTLLMAFQKSSNVTLRAIRIDGSCLELKSQIVMIN
jgi:hypothetical protein